MLPLGRTLLRIGLAYELSLLRCFAVLLGVILPVEAHKGRYDKI